MTQADFYEMFDAPWIMIECPPMDENDLVHGCRYGVKTKSGKTLAMFMRRGDASLIAKAPELCALLKERLEREVPLPGKEGM